MIHPSTSEGQSILRNLSNLTDRIYDEVGEEGYDKIGVDDFLPALEGAIGDLDWELESVRNALDEAEHGWQHETDRANDAEERVRELEARLAAEGIYL